MDRRENLDEREAEATATPAQLVVEVQFLEHGQGNAVRRVYEPAAPGESMLVPRPAPSQ